MRADLVAAVQALKPGDDIEATVVVGGRTYVHRGIVREDVDYPDHLIIPRWTIRDDKGQPISALTAVRVVE